MHAIVDVDADVARRAIPTTAKSDCCLRNHDAAANAAPDAYQFLVSMFYLASYSRRLHSSA